MQDLEAKTIQTVSYSKVLEVLQIVECNELGIKYHPASTVFYLENGSDPIRTRLHHMILNSSYGNQAFNNDSIFKFMVLHEEDEWGDETNQDLIKLRDLCKPYLTREGNYYYIYFDVSW